MVNAEYEAGPAAIAAYCNQEPPVPYPFLQDTAEDGVFRAYEALKHDLFLVAPDGLIHEEWTLARGNSSLFLLESERDEVKAAVRRVLP